MSENLFHFDVHPGLIIFLQICQIRYFLRKKDYLISSIYILDSTVHIHFDLQRCIFWTPHILRSTEMYILHSTYTSIYMDVYFALYIHFNLHRCIFCTPHTPQSTEMYILHSTYTSWGGSIKQDTTAYFLMFNHSNPTWRREGV